MIDSSDDEAACSAMPAGDKRTDQPDEETTKNEDANKRKVSSEEMGAGPTQAKKAKTAHLNNDDTVGSKHCGPKSSYHPPSEEKRFPKPSMNQIHNKSQSKLVIDMTEDTTPGIEETTPDDAIPRNAKKDGDAYRWKKEAMDDLEENGIHQKKDSNDNKSAAKSGADLEQAKGSRPTREPDPPNESKNNSPDSMESLEEVVSSYVELAPLPTEIAPLPPLSREEMSELEKALELTPGDPEEGWRADWGGNLAYVDKDIGNPKLKPSDPGRAHFKQSLLRWAENGCDGVRLLRNLMRYIYHQTGTPQRAKDIFANACSSTIQELEAAVRRASFDPVVLQQDGWQTAKSKEPVGASGGPWRIGELIQWQGFDAVVIAYVHDPDMGDLWKAMWTEDFETFDVEAEELTEARRKWERKQKVDIPSEATRRSSRVSASEFVVDGIEYGIVQARSYSRGARPGVFWPARVMHASEYAPALSTGRRNIARQKLQLVFLAPYWNSRRDSKRMEPLAESASRHGRSVFSSGSLFELEAMDASEEMIQKYPFDRTESLNIDELRIIFRLTGLPKAAFPRFLDSHRLALALKNFAATNLKPSAGDMNIASASLFEAHQLAVQVPVFPRSLLCLPFECILSNLPARGEEDGLNVMVDEPGSSEKVISLSAVLDAMKPPQCWGMKESSKSIRGPERSPISKPISVQLESRVGVEKSLAHLDRFLGDMEHLRDLVADAGDLAPVAASLESFERLLSFVSSSSFDSRCHDGVRKETARTLINSWALTKSHGEDAICSISGRNNDTVLSEWRRGCERIYKYITRAVSRSGFGNGVSIVLTDFRCNQHLTSRGCFERPVRIPAALKGAKLAGVGSGDALQLLTAVDPCYIDMAENEVLMKAHSIPYLKRMKSRCSVISPGTYGIPLTEDSDGNGGDDTVGARGSWMAAVATVGAAIKAVDMVVGGECVNAFCATRPPGHHAGRNLHPMKAVSNGFCILNAVACAALYATTPVSEGGPGLRRVCVIDIDVHHGNGTQDILCSTYDPRFLYISIHAGGPHVNGTEEVLEPDVRSPGRGSRREGIYPGRCGDSSPHEGVLNIPLGAKVTSHAVGNALISQVTPAVNKFTPELIILSTGFDAHVNDPLDLGGLTAENFGAITEFLCRLAADSCSGRLLSVLEGGYGVPCCRPQEGRAEDSHQEGSSYQSGWNQPKPQESGTQSPPHASDLHQYTARILNLGDDLPEDMDDQLPTSLQKRLDKCHAEGFIDCVKQHVQSLGKCNRRV